jgi:predicted ribosome quality control (RQC) complex YloA/Tae2 family protein
MTENDFEILIKDLSKTILLLEAKIDSLEDESERLREENQRQREHIMLLYSMVQTEHKIIDTALKEDE